MGEKLATRNNIVIIGAGQIGSRHFQALKAVNMPLDIALIDPSPDSLRLSKERYESTPRGAYKHVIQYDTTLIKTAKKIDIAIVATNADVRYAATKELLEKTSVRNIIFEKILFSRKLDYAPMESLLAQTNTNAVVNCSMRMHPLYGSIKNMLDGKIFYHASGDQFGLVTNAIHYLYHISYLVNTSDFTIDTSLLDSKPIPSKRKGFLEFTGTLRAQFADGSQAVITSYDSGEAPVQVIILNKNIRIVSKENEGRSFVAKKNNSWLWQDISSPWPFQSQMTTEVVENLLHARGCLLPSYSDVSKIHVRLLDPILGHINQHAEKKLDYYPFT